MKAKLVSAACLVAFLSATALAADPTVTLRLSYFLPPTHPLQISFQNWAKSVESASGGSLKTTIFPAEQLGKAFDQYDMARDGIADIAMVQPGYEPGQFPIAAAADLPFQYSDAKRGTAAVDAWYRKYAPTEMKDVHFCLAFMSEPSELHSRKKVTVPADLSGMKVRSPNGAVAGMVARSGGTNVNAPPPEAREPMDRGVIDGVFVPWGSTVLFGIDKAAHFHIDAKMAAGMSVLVINKAKYSSLSDVQRKAVDDNCTTQAAVKIASGWADFEAAGGDKIVNQPGQQITSLTPEQLTEWRKAAEPSTAAWAVSLRKAGGNPEQVMHELQDIIKKYNATY